MIRHRSADVQIDLTNVHLVNSELEHLNGLLGQLQQVFELIEVHLVEWCISSNVMRGFGAVRCRDGWLHDGKVKIEKIREDL